MSQFKVRRSLPASGNKLYNNGNAADGLGVLMVVQQKQG